MISIKRMGCKQLPLGRQFINKSFNLSPQFYGLEPYLDIHFRDIQPKIHPFHLPSFLQNEIPFPSTVSLCSRLEILKIYQTVHIVLVQFLLATIPGNQCLIMFSCVLFRESCGQTRHIQVMACHLGRARLLNFNFMALVLWVVDLSSQELEDSHSVSKNQLLFEKILVFP